MELLVFVLFSFLLLRLLCCISSTFKFYTKLVCYYLVLIIVPLVTIPLSIFRPGDPKNILYNSWVVHHIVVPLFGVNWEVRNEERLKTKEPCILVCNHQSSLDILGMMYIWPLFSPCIAVLKRELLFTGPFGIVSWLAGFIFLDRCNSEDARNTLNTKVKEVKEKRVKMWIFPEGTRNDNSTLLPFKKGAFHIAVQAQVPIIPVVFSSYSSFYKVCEKRFDTGTVVINILPPVYTDGLTTQDIPELMMNVRSSMLNVLTLGTNCNPTKERGRHIAES
ncbi:1-acyl-sn-glycerol-3-phosphate acyltransferase beta-like isoform X1 [Tachypleus tridentatus]|uniref:1-acyl-sn-glycerol-3-phosphate acyltransferase beta-like isoform X1 n=1 Tax=Tachypleus tridentatus TaxID=6853 RepID=UPI003FD46AF9